MKTKLLFTTFFTCLIIFGISCKEEDNAPVIKNESITLGANYANDIYYSLQNGVVAEVPRTNWDIAFSVSARSSSIIINEGASVVLKAFTGTWNWETAIDTTGYKTWPTLLNSNTTWEEGAFNANATGYPNYGWGNYDMGSHNILGTAKYVIKLRDGSFKKIFIELKKSTEQKYSFRIANLNGTSPSIVTDLNASTTNGNYVYYDLTTNSVVANREPDASTWDILFTKWTDVNSNQPYPVTGALQNIGVKAIDLTVTDINNVTYSEDQFSDEINTIGYDWKQVNMQTFVWTIFDNKVFIVKDKNDRSFKVVFKSFGGQANGNITFDVTEL